MKKKKLGGKSWAMFCVMPALLFAIGFAMRVYGGDYTISSTVSYTHNVKYSYAGSLRNTYSIVVPSGYTAHLQVKREASDYAGYHEDKSKNQLSIYVNGSKPGWSKIDNGWYYLEKDFTSDANVSISCFTAPYFHREVKRTLVGSYWQVTYEDIYYTDYYAIYQYVLSVTYTKNPSPKPKTYNVAFNPNGGKLSGGNFKSKNGTTQTATLTMTYGRSAYNAGMRAVKSGYEFIGWWTASSGGSQIYDANGRYVPNSRCRTSSGTWRHQSNATLYARWRLEPHTVKFVPNGGKLSGANFGSKNGTSQTVVLSVSCGKGTYNAGMRATRSGCSFAGWWTAKSGGTRIYDANGRYVPNSACWTSAGKWRHHNNAALYAQWR